MGRPRIYPVELEMTSIQVPKVYKKQVQDFSIKLAWEKQKNE